jgi:hypothetical protein
MKKTPMQELIERLDKEINSKYPDGYNIVMEIAKDLTEQMLEKEKEVMCEFAWEYERECRINLERSIEKCWYETFKTKEK